MSVKRAGATQRLMAKCEWSVAAVAVLAMSAFGGEKSGTEADDGPTLPRAVAVQADREVRLPEGLAPKAEAAAARWDLKNCVSRLTAPGAAGQHDLLWELAKTLQDSPKARQDADLLAVADWLLFDAGLWREPVLAKAVAGVAAASPAMEEKLLGARLKAWIATAAAGSNGHEPWLWPEYRNDGSGALPVAIKALWKDGPRSNPMTRVWMAAALASVDCEEGLPQLEEARKALAQHLPIYAKQLDLAVANSLAGGGAKACLPLLLDIAEIELAKPAMPPVAPSAAASATSTAAPPAAAPSRSGRPAAQAAGPLRGRPAGPRAFSPALMRFYGLTGWIPSLLPEAAAPEARVAEARAWLAANSAKLSWNRELNRFAGGSPQPGLEALHRAAVELDGRLKTECVDALAGPDGLESAALRAVGFAEKQPAAAGEKAFGRFLLACADSARRAHGESLCTSRWRNALYVKVPALDRELGAELWKGHIRHQLLHNSQFGPNGLAYLPARYQGVDLGVVDRARRALEPELKETLKDGNGDKDAPASELLRRHLAYLVAGGKVEDAELRKLLQAASPKESAERHGVRLWANVLASFNEPAGLRLLLLYAEVEPQMTVYCLSSFEYLTGLSDLEFDRKMEDLGPEDRAARMDRDSRWLADNSAKLNWDWSRRRFAVAGAAEGPRGKEAQQRHRPQPAPDAEPDTRAPAAPMEQF